MRYLGRELRRLWEVKLYKGDPDAKKPKFKKETVVAWNTVDAIRQMGSRPVAEEPVQLTFVTWPEEDQDADEIYEIHDTSGPTNKKVKPTVPIAEDF